MKKITLLLSLFTCAVNAQTFPAPYCDITDPMVTVEEITTVNFNNVTITNTNFSDNLVDYTATQIPVAPGQSYTLEVFGNTYGNFDTEIVAFIDWNNNGVLDDAGEVYELGKLTNATGSNGVSVTMSVQVPATAAAGMTRVRITKVFTDIGSEAIVDPCAISFDITGAGTYASFGQALDFNLNVSTLSSATFDSEALSIYPVPAKNKVTIAYKSAIGNMQVYNQLGQEVYSSRNLGSQASLDVSGFANGVYFIKLYNEKEAQTFRIVKN